MKLANHYLSLVEAYNRQDWIDLNDKQLNEILYLLKDIFPDIKRTGNAVHVGSIYFEPIIKRDISSDHSMIGIKIATGYDWTPYKRVMLKSDGSIDSNKIKKAVLDQQQIIQDMFNKDKK